MRKSDDEMIIYVLSSEQGTFESNWMRKAVHEERKERRGGANKFLLDSIDMLQKKHT